MGNPIPLALIKDKTNYRRVHVVRLTLQGLKQKDVAKKIGCSLSTIEKDLQDIRERSKQWYENESIKDFCQSLHDSIIIHDNAIEDLQILYQEYDDLDSKLKILLKISNFEERKTELYEKTYAVQKFIEEYN